MKFGVSLPVRELENDLAAIRDFAQAAEGLGLTHLRVPEQIIRPASGHLHESMMILAYVAAITEKIELVPSVVILPARQTALFACLLYTSPSPRDAHESRMPSSA